VLEVTTGQLDGSGPIDGFNVLLCIYCPV